MSDKEESPVEQFEDRPEDQAEDQAEDQVDDMPVDDEEEYQESDAKSDDEMEPDDAEVEDEEDEPEAEEEEEDEEEDEKEKKPKVEEVEVPVKRKRGRPPGSGKKKAPKTGRFQPLQVPLDENGEPYKIENDELMLPEDPKGEEKVDKLGVLKGAREFRIRTFTILGRGQRLYMLATEPARCIGFRDSYLLFQRHRNLLKVKLSDDEKFDLIDRELIPHSYKGRTLGVVTARSIFREFGARVIVGGHRVVDDYYEAQAITEGHTSDELADPDDFVPFGGQQYDKNQYVAWYSGPSHSNSQALYESNLKSVLQQQGGFHMEDLAGFGRNQQKPADMLPDPPLDPQLAARARFSAGEFNKRLARQQRRVLGLASQNQIFDNQTNIPLRSLRTQPFRSVVQKTSDDNNGAVEITTVVRTVPQVPEVPEAVPEAVPEEEPEEVRVEVPEAQPEATPA